MPKRVVAQTEREGHGRRPLGRSLESSVVDQFRLSYAPVTILTWKEGLDKP